MSRALRADKLIETAEQMSQRITKRFPGSGLASVANEVVSVTREAARTAEEIASPIWWIRISLPVLLVLLIIAASWEPPASMHVIGRLYEFFSAAPVVGLYFVLVIVYFVTLEIRFKRHKAMKAIRGLRAMAHIIDMHQLPKDPARVMSDDPHPLSAEQMGQYLHYCTELLAVLSKIGQLYIQDLPDATASAAVDQFENLATSLSQKIWQKIIILDRIRADAEVLEAAEAKPSEPK
jgi:hypothetical protein